MAPTDPQKVLVPKSDPYNVAAPILRVWFKARMN